VGQRAQKAPGDASKEARKLKNRMRLKNQSQKLGATRKKYALRRWKGQS
jgi:hypothetical protein